MLQILLHLIGDYLLQNDWMAARKTRFDLEGWLACSIHSILYTLPFMFFFTIKTCAIILVTHFLIDKFQLALYWIKLINWRKESTNYGFSDKKPVWVALWLFVIIDNSFHLIINYAAICYFSLHHCSCGQL